jgi:predicted O-methyltransferase YrrM
MAVNIPKQLNANDVQTLISIMNFVSDHGPYSYLEIGSYLGGSLQWHLSNSNCLQVISIDKRSCEKIKDERLIDYAYSVTTQDMLNMLKANDLPVDKLITIDGTVDNIPVDTKFDLVFVDAEHTNQAVLYDGKKCLDAVKQDAVIMFHDDWIVYKGLEQLEQHLVQTGKVFGKFKITGSDITAIVLGRFIEHFESNISNASAQWLEFVAAAEKKLSTHLQNSQGNAK